MYVEALKRVADLVETLEGEPLFPPEESTELYFNMIVWRCDTAACAIGHACLDPWFNRQGFRLCENTIFGPLDTASGSTGYPAIKNFFDIPLNDVDYLFNPAAYHDHCRDPIFVAMRIRKYVEDNNVHGV